MPALVLGRLASGSDTGGEDMLPERGCSATGDGCLRGDDGPETLREWEEGVAREDGTGGVPTDCEAREEDVERVRVRWEPLSMDADRLSR